MVNWWNKSIDDYMLVNGRMNNIIFMKPCQSIIRFWIFRTKRDDTNQTIKKLLGKREIDKNAVINKKLLKAAKILERMVNQNTYNDIAQGNVN